MKVFLAFTGILCCLRVFAQEQGDRDSAIYYISKGQYARALPFSKRNFETLTKISNNDTARISAAERLGAIYYEQGKDDSTLVYYMKACEGIKKQYGDTSVQYGSALVNIAKTYTRLARYQEAEESYQNAIAILERKDNPYYSKAYTWYLIEYADFSITTGNFNKAEELSLIACEMALREPVDMDAYILAQERLSRFFRKMGFSAQRKAVAIRIFEAAKERYGEEHPKYAMAIGNLGDIYQREKKMEQADSLYRKTLEIKQRTLGNNVPANIHLLTRIGIVNMEMRKYRIAESYLEEVMKIINENGGEKFPLYAYAAKNMAKLYALTGRKELAEPLYQKCLAIYSRNGLVLNSDCLNLLHSMAELFYADDPAKAARYLQEVMVAENKLLLEKLDFLSETELLAWLRANKDIADSPYGFLLHHKSPKIAGAAYNRRLLTGGISLQNIRGLYQSMTQSKDGELTLLWENYQQQKSYYTNLLLTPAAKRNVNTDSVADVLNRQEKDILRRSAEYRNMKEKLSITWQDLRKHLQPGEAAIEFVRFNGKSNISGRMKADLFYYAALLLRPQDTVPQFIVLCEEKQLIAAMKKFPYKAAGNSRGRKVTTPYHQSATHILYQLLWQPIKPYLVHTKTVYFSPDGMLHRVAFAAIPYNKSELLCDKYDLVQLTSTRQVALPETRSQAPALIAMFGGINYNRQSVPDTGYASSARLHSSNRAASPDSFIFLPNTLKEINTIQKTAGDLQKQTIVFTAGNATEAAFRSLGGDHSPGAIHFATHGFTLPDNPVQKNDAGAFFSESPDPLLRCGLVMAGGNKGWKGKAGQNEDDGILTGLEISAVQLPNTQLAVLSACETGLGKIEGSEGVFGLQRAFKLAGVNYIIASLWQVPDKETAEFMEIFYNHWLGGKTIREAFFSTQKIMRKKYAPYYWAGFTLVQ